MAKADKKDTSKAIETAPEPPKDDSSLVVKEDVTTLAPAAAATAKQKFNFKAFLKTKKGKIVAVLVAVILIIGVVFAVPASRYAVAGLVVKKDVMVELTDSETGKPVSAADVTLGRQTYKTNAHGKATFTSIAAGNWHVSTKKSYYQDGATDVLVPILSNPGTVKISVVATGRQVPVTVTNKITGEAIANAEILANDAAATTAENGEATLVLPADKQTVSAMFKVSGYNDLTADITITEQIDDKNKFALTPVGTVYFLTKRTGKVDVMSSNLDGSNQKVVLAGTGKETDNNAYPELIPSADWKHLVLKARRDNDVKLYSISTTDNKLTTIDEGAGIDFTTIGWAGDSFVYQVFRPTVKMWEAKRFSLKAYSDATKKITTLDDTEGTGTGPGAWLSQIYAFTRIVDGRVVFVKYWEDQNMTGELNTKKDPFVTVKPDGSDKKTVKEFTSPWTKTFELRANKPDSFYLRVIYHVNPTEYFEYLDGQLTTTTAVDANTFYSNVLYYKVSPSGKHTAWQEFRDKWVVLVGDEKGANGTVVFSENGYQPLGWFTDDYLLLVKDGTLYVYPTKPQTGAALQKVTEFLSVNYIDLY